MMIHCGDNLEIMRSMESESVDLIATDPPYNTGRDFGAYDDRRGGGYIDWLAERLTEMRRLLNPTGSIYLQCDPHESHYIKCKMDEIFGRAKFRNEIVWKRTSAKRSTNRFACNHDLILTYSKTNKPFFKAVERPWGRGLDAYKYEDENGVYSWASTTAPGYNPDRMYEFMGVKPCRNWAWSRERMEQAANNGMIKKFKNSLRRKQYLKDTSGPKHDDVWVDIDVLSSMATERRECGYPTQKPIALYERIIKASCPEGGIVFDPFAGSGTTLVAAKGLGREFIGIDINPEAVKVAEERLAGVML